MTPPCTFDNERAVLTAFLDSSTGLTEASQLLTPEDFSDPLLRQGWEWMTAGVIAGKPVDLYSLSQRWGHHADFPLLKNALADCQTVFGEGPFYAATLKDRARIRKAYAALETALKTTARAATFEDARPSLESALMTVYADADNAADCTIRQAIDAVRTEMKNPAAAKRVFPTGYSRFDAMFKRSGGPTEGNLIIIAGKTGEGKSSLALNFVAHAASQGIPAKVYSLEMDRNDLAIRSALFFARDAASFDTAMSKAADMPVWFSDRPDRTMDSIRSDIRISALRHGIKLAVVDYIQLAKASGSQSKENRERQVADMSRTLKVAAGESRVVVYALSQLNDEGKLRESRAIEQDADGVVYVVQKEGYHYLWVSKLRRGERHGEAKEIPAQLVKRGIKLDFDADNFRFHQHP